MVWHPDTGRVIIYYNLIIEMVKKSNNHQATYPMLLFNYPSFHFAHQKLFEKAFNFTGDLAVLWSSKMKHIQWLYGLLDQTTFRETVVTMNDITLLSVYHKLGISQMVSLFDRCICVHIRMFNSTGRSEYWNAATFNW